MKPSRIIVVFVDPPLPFGRAMGRWYYVLYKGLIERGHNVTAFATCRTEAEIRQTQALFPRPDYDLRCYLTHSRPGWRGKIDSLRRPFSFNFSPAMRQDLKAELDRGTDVLHLELVWAGWVGLDQIDRAVLTVPFLWRLDLADQPPKSLKERINRARWLSTERALLRRYRQIVAVSPRLASTVSALNPRADVATIPFGMDLSLYPMIERPADAPDRPPTIGLIASFDWTPGMTAGARLLDRLWPAIKARVPSARLHLAGTHALTAFREHVGRPDVTIEDHVSDVPGFFRSIDLQLYAPNNSSGMKFKVLESFAFGIPVVTNGAGCEGIPAVDGVHAGLCEDDAGLIDRTVALLENPARRERQRQEARALLESHCSPGPVLDQIERHYEESVLRRPSPASSPVLAV